MNSWHRILAATDLSAPARHAAERAALISKETSAALDLLHVANLAPLERLRQLMGASPSEMEQRVADAARLKLQDLASALKQRFDVAAATHVLTGSLLDALKNQAQARDAGLLVCGARGESVIRRLALGSTSSRLLSTTTRPVLVVKQQPHEPYRRILVPVDFSAASLQAIQDARRIAPAAGIVLLHVFDVPFEGQLRYASVDQDTISQYRVVARQDSIQKLNALRAQAGLAEANVSLAVAHGQAALRILEQEQEHDCDLIVMGKHGEHRIEELLLGSVTEQILSESQGDVLVSA